ncbi:MAG: hypothetical protein AMXMBFR53_22270 [Gemmatimonadota bacterium]
MRTPRITLAAALVGISVAGCGRDDGPVSVDPPDELTATALADVVAAALAVPAHRTTVLEAMRASPFVENKLSLPDLASSPGGRLLLEDGAAIRGVAMDDVEALLGRLGDLDFYLPFAEQRRLWSGDANVLVGWLPDPDSPSVTAFAPDGGKTSVSAAAAPPATFFLMQGAEPRFRRPGASAVRTEGPIEALTDALRSEEVCDTSMETCPDDPTVTNGVVTPVVWAGPMGDLWGCSEIFIDAQLTGSFSTQYGRWEGSYCDIKTTLYPGARFFSRRPQGSDQIRAEAWEMDVNTFGIFSANEYYGPAVTWTAGESGASKLITRPSPYKCEEAGFYRCYAVATPAFTPSGWSEASMARITLTW